MLPSKLEAIDGVRRSSLQRWIAEVLPLDLTSRTANLPVTAPPYG